MQSQYQFIFQFPCYLPVQIEDFLVFSPPFEWGPLHYTGVSIPIPFLTEA